MNYGSLNIRMAQFNPVMGDLRGNTARMIEIYNDAPDNCDLIVYPEMSVCGYPPEDLLLKPFFIDKIHESIDELCAKTKGNNAAMMISAPWRDEHNDQIYSALLTIENGAIIHKTYKYHLPNIGVFDEKRTLEQGQMPDVLEFRGIKIGGIICEDMWYYDVASHLKTQGAQILICVNGSPFEIEKYQTRIEIARQRSLETNLPFIYVNQVGGQDELVFDGASFITNQKGEIVLSAKTFAEDIIDTHWSITNKKLECVTNHIEPVKDSLEIIYDALVCGLRDYVTKNGFPGVVLGMSGGIDSALSAVIAADALGADNVHCIMMPYKYTSEESLKDAKECAAALGVRYDIIDITKPAEAFSDVLAPHLDKNTPPVTYENIQPRTRGLILMALSNASGKMVLSTGNKSEMAVGYATLYGDMCGGFNALKDVYKTLVYDLADWRNKSGQHIVIPQNIIEKAPTAELKDNQTDQDTLPPYDVLDAILECLIEKEMSVEDITVLGHDKDTVIKIWRMLDSAEYKRRQSPPGVKITSCAFGRDRRYPITNKFKKMFAD